MSLLPLSVVASTLSPDPREAAVAARTLRFAGLMFDAVGPSLDLTGLSASGRREFRQVLSARDQQLVGLQVDLGPKGLGPGADLDRIVSRLDKVFETAAGMAAPLVCVGVGPLPEPPRVVAAKPTIAPEQAGLILIPSLSAPTAQVPPPTPLDAAFAGHVDAGLAELGLRADRYTVTVAFQSELSSLAALERALLAARCPWFGVDLDPVAILRDEWPGDEAFARLGPLIRHVRGRDAVAGADRRTKPMPIGRGDTKWDRLLADLDGAGYHGWVTIDPTDLADRPAAARGGLAYLKLHQG